MSGLVLEAGSITMASYSVRAIKRLLAQTPAQYSVRAMARVRVRARR